MDMYNDGVIPIYIKGNEIEDCDQKRITRIIKESVQQQYGKDAIGLYDQLDNKKRALIIDNFHATKLNRNGLKELLNHIIPRFVYIVTLGNSSLRVEEILNLEAGTSPLLNFSHLELRSFGNVLRERLIRRWLSIGQEYTIDLSQLSRQAITLADSVQHALGADLVPSYPVYILIFVQQIEANRPLTTANGSLGYFFEILITAALSSDTKYLDVDTKFTFLSRIAYSMHLTGVTSLDHTNMVHEHQSYHQDYRISFSLDTLIDDMLRQHILQRVTFGYVFRYPYVDYYFIARYIRDHLAEPQIRERVKYLVTHAHVDSYANILIVLSYLSKDPFIVETMLDQAISIFSDVPICRLDKDVTFLNNIHDKVPKLIILDKPHPEAREEYYREVDEMEDSIETNNVEPTSEQNMQEEVEVISKINQAFRTIEIIGQILRNFPGSIRGDVKADLTNECYTLGLRTVNVFFTSLEEGMESITSAIVERYRKKKEKIDTIDLRLKVSRFLFFVSQMIAYSAIKRISYSLGSTMLDETYREVLGRDSSPAFKLIDTAIRLDHFWDFPVTIIEEQAVVYRSNPFALSLLQNLVAERFFLFPEHAEVKQSICKKVGIELTKADLLDDKRYPPRGKRARKKRGKRMK